MEGVERDGEGVTVVVLSAVEGGGLGCVAGGDGGDSIRTVTLGSNFTIQIFC